ncbi:ComF family protein [Thalassotalea piscium]|uniref:ComF family protein n=1 Tax=Thalassotalea piscium TaxID=1230533 RepID=A0A7X0NG52_9GAMM|nr:ComF family protein [Thalassotalea piscium]MBB6542844.1 ComF family protein [Thalassotalea piscium]
MEFLVLLFKQRLLIQRYQQLVRCYWLKVKTLCLLLAHELKTSLARCDLCNNLSDGEFICRTCQHDIGRFNLPKGTNNLLLWPAVDKIFQKRKFDQLICYAPYIWPYDVWLKQLKYQAKFELAPLLAKLLTRCWQDHLSRSSQYYINNSLCITSVPIHLTKWQTRGFNQAHLIAKHFAQANNLHYNANLLSRIKHGDSQVGQSGIERRKNLANAFTANTQLLKKFSHVVVIDDVITTGTTANEISRVLKKGGVEQVTIMTVALSLPLKK